LLRHIVELSMQGQGDRLKERQIAVEVFHRKPTYDNNADPVVRVAAGEVRKRLAQYYGNPENAGELRIELPIGSYVPVFHFPMRMRLSAEEATAPCEVDEPSRQAPERIVSLAAPASDVIAPAARRSRTILLAVLGGVVLLAGAAVAWRGHKPVAKLSGFDTFWAPLLNSPSPPMISVGELHARELTFIPDTQRDPGAGAFAIYAPKDVSDGLPVERIDSLQAVAKIAAVLGAKGRAFDLQDETNTTFADFAGRPTILLGAYENDWSMGLSSGRRFEFKADYARGLKWISDRQKPGLEIGSLPTSSTPPSSYDAYAIVMRDTGSVSHQSRIMLAGVGDDGTVAAAEFVSNPKYLDAFAQHAPPGWADRNIEILLRTRVVEGILGIPTVADISIW
jgi:hypothetical protein